MSPARPFVTLTSVGVVAHYACRDVKTNETSKLMWTCPISPQNLREVQDSSRYFSLKIASDVNSGEGPQHRHLCSPAAGLLTLASFSLSHRNVSRHRVLHQGR